MTHDEIVRLKEERHRRIVLERERNTGLAWSLFKPCLKGLHENCAIVNVFDANHWCSCICHGKD